jgi:hypothetical protein
MAERLCLSVTILINQSRLRLDPEAQPQLFQTIILGKAEPYRYVRWQSHNLLLLACRSRLLLFTCFRNGSIFFHRHAERFLHVILNFAQQLRVIL